MSSDKTEPERYLGALLRPCWQWIRNEVYEAVVAAGYDDLNRAHVGMFRHPGMDHRRPSELADELQITRQSVNELLSHLEVQGYIVRKPDPDDGRARVVRLTAEGRRLQAVVHDAARRAEESIADLLGPKRFEQLRATLEELVVKLVG
jgi:DNA-binding MarR family transcriptional regulator